MKTTLAGLGLFALTAATIVTVPYIQNAGAGPAPLPGSPPTPAHVPPVRIPMAQTQGAIDVVFVLDTTGSMSGLIAAAKEKIWSIATTMAQAQGAPRIRMGLVAYRDRGEAYVTRTIDLSEDLDSMYAQLMEFQAAGGGDTPEAVNEALHDAVHAMSWSAGRNTYRVVFLVGDAPAHTNYANDVPFTRTLEQASAKNIIVNAIQCGRRGDTATQWRQIASLGQGAFLNVGQAGNAVAIATPFDEKLATLSAEFDSTRLYYGDEEKRAERQKKVEATTKLHEGSSVESRARRATFNLSGSGRRNAVGEGDLAADVAAGRVELKDVDAATLPEPLQAMAPAAREAHVKETAQKRAKLEEQMQALAKQRTDYLRQEASKKSDIGSSLDDQLYRAIRSQAGSKGLVYEAESASY